MFNLKRESKTGQEVLQRIADADVFSICLDKELIVPHDPQTGNCMIPRQSLVDKVKHPFLDYTQHNS